MQKFINLFVGLMVSTLSIGAGAATLNVRLLETSDLHMHLAGYDYYQDKPSITAGLTRTATLIATARKEQPNTLLMDDGDLLQGSPVGDYAAREETHNKGWVHPAFKLMNALHYDVATVGNHEFNYGLPFLLESLKGAKFPYVSANVVNLQGECKGEPLLPPYVLLSRQFIDDEGKPQTLTIGFIGLVTPQIMQWDHSYLAGKVEAEDIVETARHYVPQMRAEGADLIVALAHTGISDQPYKKGEENAGYHLAEQVDGLDVIMTGHQHRRFPGNPDYMAMDHVDAEHGTLFGKAVVMPRAWGADLGIVDLKLAQRDGRWQVVDQHSTTRSIFERVEGEARALVKPDPEAERVIRPDHQATIDYMRQPISSTRLPIDSYFSLVHSSTAVQVVNQAQLWYVRQLMDKSLLHDLPLLSAAAPYMAGGGEDPDNYVSIPAGKISLKDASSLYIYADKLQVVRISGALLRDWLEFSAGQYNTIDPRLQREQALINEQFPAYYNDQILGVDYRIDLTQPPRYDPKGKLINPQSQRIVELSYNGEPVDDDRQFLVVTNSYRASGGSNCPGLDGSQVVFDAPDMNRDAVIKYLDEHENLEVTAPQNWGFLSVGNAHVTFESTPQARANLPQDIAFESEQSNGFALYRLN